MTKPEFMAFVQPYGCKVVDTNLHKVIIEDFGIDTNRWLKEVIKDNYKPILYPLSDCKKLNLNFTHNSMCEDLSNRRIDLGHVPFSLVYYLVVNHFDIANLIEFGEAIDINTLEINPYK